MLWFDLRPGMSISCCVFGKKSLLCTIHVEIKCHVEHVDILQCITIRNTILCIFLIEELSHVEQIETLHCIWPRNYIFGTIRVDVLTHIEQIETSNCIQNRNTISMSRTKLILRKSRSCNAYKPDTVSFVAFTSRIHIMSRKSRAQIAFRTEIL